MWVIILSIILFLIIIYLIFNRTVYKPVWTIETKIDVPSDSETLLYYEVLLPIKEIPNENVLLTPLEIKNRFLDCDYIEVINLLGQYGNIIWESPSGTMVLIETTPSKIPTKLYLINDDVGTLNNRWTLKYQNKEIIFNKINFEIENGIETLDSLKWSEKYNIIKQPLGNPQGKLYTIDVIGEKIQQSLNITGGSIGLLEIENVYPNITGLQTLATTMGFPQDKFVNQIIQTTQHPSPSGYIILENQFNDYGLSEIDYDLQAVFSLNPDITCVIFFIPNSILVLLPLWISASNPTFPNIWSSSLTYDNKSNINDKYRLHQEYKLLSLAGITTFQSSGDQGNYSSQMSNLRQTGDISKIDVVEGFFDSPYTIKVGGFNYCNYPDNFGFTDKTSFTQIFILSNETDTSNPYDIFLNASGGGFDRGMYSDPSWKLKITNNYRNTIASSVKIKQLPNGKIVPFEELSFDKLGNSTPDIIGIATTYVYDETSNSNIKSIYGTSISAPFNACIFASIEHAIGKPLMNVCKVLYENRYLMSRPLQGRNNFFNTYGYPTAQVWDPVQGLGIPDPAKLLEFFKNY